MKFKKITSQRLILFLGLLFLSIGTYGQVAVEGIVLDENNLPLPGATIIVKETKQGTTADFDGNFKIEAAIGETLQISFIGFTTVEYLVAKSESKLTIILKGDAQGLEEIVVVGYGTQKRSNLTGAVSDINVTEDIGDRPVANIQQMLQGTVPSINVSLNNDGGEPGAANNMNIRGIGTLTGNNGSPYILLDGIPITVGQLNSINPSDIETVSVLKDAASAAIYGARGAFGVILITTKSGEAGALKVNYSNIFAQSAPTIIPKFANSLDFAEMYNLGAVNEGQNPFFSDEIIQNIKDYQAGTIGVVPIVNSNNGNESWPGHRSGYGNTNWYDEMYKGWAPRSQHNISISGGNENTTFYVSGNWFDQGGNLKFAKDDYDRLNFTTNLKTKATDWLSFDVSTKYSRETRQIPTGAFGIFGNGIIYHQIARMWPVNFVYNDDGQLINRGAIELRDGGVTDKVTNTNFIRLSTEIEPIKGWKTRISYNWSNVSRSTEAIALRAHIEQPDGRLSNVGFNPSRVTRTLGNGTDRLINITTGYTKSFNDHNFSTLVGYEERLNESESLWGRKTNLITPSLPTLSTAVGEDALTDDTLTHFSTQGVFGRFSYNYKEKYLFEFNGRYDGSSFFKDGNRWGFFPSVSAGYNVAKEPFWAPLESVVNNFKLRASWGQLGNHDPELAGLYLERLPASTSSWLIGGSQPNIVNSPTVVSPNLSWETVTTTNIGLDASLFRNRLQVNFDWFNRTTTDMIGPVGALPLVLGSAAPRENVGELQTKGIELVLSWRGQIGEVNYEIGANLADNQTKIIKWNNPTNSLTTFREGQQLGDIWGYETVGYFESDAAVTAAATQTQFFPRWGPGDIQYADLDGDGDINIGENTSDNPGDRRIIGNSNPRYSYGINLKTSYKGLQLAVLFQGVGKRDIAFNENTNLMFGFRGNRWQNNVSQAHLDYWTPENTNAYFPKPYLNAQHKKNTRVQTKYLQDASYIRMKNIQLSYNFPKPVLDNLGLDSFKVFFSGENLITITNLFENFDPEALGGSWGSGKIYPLQKVISVGLNIGI